MFNSDTNPIITTIYLAQHCSAAHNVNNLIDATLNYFRKGRQDEDAHQERWKDATNKVKDEFIGARTYPSRFSTEFYATLERIIENLLNRKVIVRSTSLYISMF